MNGTLSTIVSPLRIFIIRREERWVALTALLVFVCLNALLISSHWSHYTHGAPGGFWTLFTRRFMMSGYDCWSWLTVSGMRIHFMTDRHPLYLTFLYPMYLLNHWLMDATGVNFAVFFIAVVVVFSACYSAIFMYRIFRELLSMTQAQACLLLAMLFSFGHVMIPTMVPDHFIISMMLLTMTIYIAGKKIRTGRQLKAWQTMCLLFFTSGIATSNGIKTLLAAWFVNGKRVFRPRFIMLGVALPLALLWAIQRYQYYRFEIPQTKTITKIEKANAKKHDPKKAAEIKKHREWVKQHDMRRAADSGVLNLIDLSTPRVPVIVENFLGESILLHRDYALRDVFKDRPVIVKYRSWWSYILVFSLVAVCLAGIWLGRKDRLMQMLLCWLAFDITLHLVLGFAINEVYIMAAGWIFIIPIAACYVLKHIPERYTRHAELLLLLATLYLWGNNAALIIRHLI